MAGNRVVIRFIGEDNSLSKSLTKLHALAETTESKFSKAGSAIGGVVKPLGLLGAAGGAVHTLAGVAAAGQQLLPIALLLPGALLAGGAAMATFKLATSGFAEALSGDAEALAKLSPAARATAQAVIDLKPKFEALKSSVQDKFFAGFAADVKNLGNNYLPILGKRLPEIASGFNVMGRSVSFALNQKDTQGNVDKILGNTSATLRAMPNFVANVVSGFISLGAAGSKYLVPIGRFLDGIGDKFRRWVDLVTANGDFDRWIGAAKAGFSDLFHIIGNVGSVLGSVFSGLSAGSGASSPLATLRDMTGALKDFFQSAEAQGPLRALGETMAALAKVVKDVLVAGLKALGPIVQALAPIVTTLGETVGSIMVSAFEQLGPPLTRLIQKLTPILQKLLPWLGEVIKTVVIPALAWFIDFISTTIDNVESFAQSSVVAFLQVASTALGFASTMLGVTAKVLYGLSQIGGPGSEQLLRAAKATMGAKDSVDQLRGTVDQLHSKAVDIQAHTQGLREVQDLVRTIGLIPAVKTVTVNAVARVSSIIGNIFGGRAVGGTVNKGQSYLVGERGPEILTMGGSGYVTPNHKMDSGSGSSSGPVVTFAGNTTDALATVIQQMVRTGKIQIAA